MREVCDQYGMLLIFDEVMCGMGRTGHLHAWQAESDDVAPDIQLVGKGLAGGFQPISAMLVGHKVIEAFESGPSNGAFSHGHTFQNHPMAAAAALEVQRIIQDEKLLQNVKEKGPLLEKKIRERLEHHRYVGDIRGPKKGLFLGVGFIFHLTHFNSLHKQIHFVQNKDTKKPFDASESIWMNMYNKGMSKNKSSICFWLIYQQVLPKSTASTSTRGLGPLMESVAITSSSHLPSISPTARSN
jgi:adenosylmethionine-8-amino-7-oxononanoate aminotransferase